MKTIIELFDECQIENVAAALRFKPEKIIFVGFKAVMTKKRINDIERFFKEYGEDILLEFELVGRYNYSLIVKKLCDIIKNNDDCCFDVTGGRELLLLAMGDVATRYNAPMVQFNIRTGNYIKIKNCSLMPETEKKTLSIEKIVMLNGGTIVRDSIHEPEWNLTADFKKDIKAIWDICKKDSTAWNKLSGILGGLGKNISSDLFVRFNIEDANSAPDEKSFKELSKKGLIVDYNNRGGIISFRYKNEQVHRCLVKAGNVLELYAYMAAKEIEEKAPGFYDDIDIGVMVDWDGVMHPHYDNIAETRNEIDVMMMRDLVPIFISCKNGEVHKEALYELDTVARKFGGEYSKKILVATHINSSASNRKHLLQRAKDMKIEVIEGIHKKSYEEFVEILKKRAK